MKRILSIICLCLSAVLFSGVSSYAQDIFFSTAHEKNAFQEATNGHYIAARNEAEKILKEDPDSLGALYALGYVFWLGEGNHLRAMQYFKKLLEEFEDKYCDAQTGIPEGGELQSWHQRIMNDLADVYAELDDRGKEVAVYERLARLYHTRLAMSAVWGLMKLDRFEEAEEISREALNDSFWADTAHNNLTAIYDAMHEHTRAFEASQRSVEFTNEKSRVVLLNHARSLALFLRLDEAIEYYLKSQSAPEHDSVSSPLVDLAPVYLLNGEWQRAISALAKGRKLPVKKNHEIYTEMANRLVTSEILYAMGFGERSWEFMKTVVDAPGRMSFNSILQEQMDLASLVMFYAITEDAIRRADEALDAYLVTEPFWLFKSEVRRRVRELRKDRDDKVSRQWSTNQKIFKKALDPRSIKSFLIPFYAFSPLFECKVVDALGRQTTELFVRYEESNLTEDERAQMRTMFDVIRAYIAWRSGDLADARGKVEIAQQSLKPRMKLIESQVRLMAADIADRSGNTEEAFKLYPQVYQDYPAVFRQFDVKLPVVFDESLTKSGSDEIDRAYKILSKSSRFEAREGAPFRITAEYVDKLPMLCLSSAMGGLYACSSVDSKDYDISPEATPHVAEIVNSFYHKAFAPLVDVSQAELNSLDGSPVQMSADQALEKILGAPKVDREQEE
ncbi:MAG: tetratricopeptide repeat protein [Proteobacteria bacterium]|nr:tetratricopeptide repeat protein [Pseudomonadota bacterium]